MRGEVGRASDDAVEAVYQFVEQHRQAAIPALISACVLWAVENGGKDVVKGTLRRAVKLADDLAAANKRRQS